MKVKNWLCDTLDSVAQIFDCLIVVLFWFFHLLIDQTNIFSRNAMSRYRWGKGKWYNCLPNSKIKYDSGSDTEDEDNKKVQASSEKSNISSSTRKEILPKNIQSKRNLVTKKRSPRLN